MNNDDGIVRRMKAELEIFNEPPFDVCFIGIPTKLREHQVLVFTTQRLIPRRLVSVLAVVMHETK